MARSDTFARIDHDPEVFVDSPVAGAVLSGVVHVAARVVYPPGAPEDRLDYRLILVPLREDGSRGSVDTEWQAAERPFSGDTWDTTRVPNGTYRLVVQSDPYWHGYASSTSVVVEVDNPSLFMTSMPPGNVLSGSETLTYDFEEPGWTFERAYLSLHRANDYNPYGFKFSDGGDGDRTLSVNVAAVANGAYEAVLTAYGRGPDGVEQRRQLRMSVTVANPDPVLTPVSPAPGSIVRGPALDIDLRPTRSTSPGTTTTSTCWSTDGGRDPGGQAPDRPSGPVRQRQAPLPGAVAVGPGRLPLRPVPFTLRSRRRASCGGPPPPTEPPCPVTSRSTWAWCPRTGRRGSQRCGATA